MTAYNAGRTANQSIFEHLNVKPIINACGVYTELGGSRLSPRVWAAMEEANRSFVQMSDLLDKSGERIAELLGAEAAYVTPGAAAGIMLCAAASMVGMKSKRSERLPITRGMKNEVLIQKGHRYRYDRQVTMTGAKLIDIGSPTETRANQLIDAITHKSVMIVHPAHLDGKPGTLPLEQVHEIAHPRGVPIFVDAAYMNYPTDIMGGYLKRGADLVCISAKYFGGPNAGGFVIGREELVGALPNVNFTGYESGNVLKYGRPLKMDRQTIVAVVVALEEWLETDHEARLSRYARLVGLLKDKLEGLPGVRPTPMCFTMDEQLVPEPVNCLVLEFDRAVTGTTASVLADRLAAGSPSIWVIKHGDKLALATDVLEESEVAILADRLRDVMKV